MYSYVLSKVLYKYKMYTCLKETKICETYIKQVIV